MANRIIDLEDYRVVDKSRGIKSKVFTGRDRGRCVREKSKIDAYIKAGDCVTIEVPSDIYSINPSFLEEFLFNAVISIGKEEFFSRVSFNCHGNYDCVPQVRDAVNRILRSSTAIG